MLENSSGRRGRAAVDVHLKMHRVVKNEFKEYENFGIKGYLMFRHKNKGYDNLH